MVGTSNQSDPGMTIDMSMGSPHKIWASGLGEDGFADEHVWDPNLTPWRDRGIPKVKRTPMVRENP